MSRILKGFLWTLGILIGLAFFLPLIFKNKLVSLAKKTINENLAARVDFQDPSLTILSSFPYVRLGLDEVLITGIDTFARDTLFYSPEVDLSASLKVLWKKNEPVTLRRIELVQPYVNLITLANGSTNFNLLETAEAGTSEESAGTQFKLDKITIQEGNFKYLDAQSQTRLTLNGVNLQSSGQYTQDVVNLDNEAEIAGLDFQQGAIDYLQNAVVSWKGGLTADLGQDKYTLEQNQFVINALELALNGWVHLKAESTDLEFSFNAPSNDIKQVMSLIPGLYQHQFADLDTRGEFTLAGKIFGTYQENISYPQFDLQSAISDGWVKYKSMPHALEGLTAQLMAKSLDQRLENYQLQLPAFAFSLNQRPIKGELNILASPNDLHVRGKTNGSIKLEDWQNFLPLDSTTLQGTIFADLDFDFTQNAVLRKQYDQIKFKGQLAADDLKVKPLQTPHLAVKKITAAGDAKMVNLSLEDVHYGRSRLSGQGQISNLLALSIGAWSSALINLSLDAPTLDLNEMLTADAETSIQDTAISISDPIPPQLNVQFKAKAGQVNYADYDLKNIQLEGEYRGDSLLLKQFSGIVNQSGLNANGVLAGVYAWSDGNGKLTGNLKLTSPEFKVDPWMSAEEPSSTPAPSVAEKILPENTQVSINTNLGKVTYDTYTLTNLKGTIQLVNQVLEMHEIDGQGFGGAFTLDGVFDDSGLQPAFNFKYDLKKLAMAKLFQSSSMFRKLVPIAEFLDGTLSSSVVMSGQLDKDMNPVWDEFDAAGLLETFNGIISKFGPLEKAAKEFKFPTLNILKWEKSKNWFTVEKGTLIVNPFPIHYQGLEMIISGKHQIDQDIAYNVMFKFPREVLQKNNLTAQFNSGISWLANQVKQKGLNVGTLDTIFIQMALNGNIKDPAVKFTWAGDLSGKPMEQQVTDQLKSAVEEKKDSLVKDIQKETQKIKDSAITILEQKTNEAVDVVSEKAKEVVDSAGKVIGSKAKEVIDSTLADKLGKAVDSTARSKIDTLLGKKGKEEVDKIKDQIKNWDPFKKKKKPEGNGQ